MFLDVCFPKNNEKEFIEVARKLSTDGLVFLYSKKPGLFTGKYPQKNKMKLVFTSDLSHKSKNPLFYFYEGIEDKKTFHAPSKLFTQVKMKELKKSLLGLSFFYMMNNSKEIEKISFIVKLATKYNTKLFLGSFARSPYQLRSKKELAAIGKIIGMDTQVQRKSLVNLHDQL